MFDWLKRKQNRRSGERAYMLDVKLRTRQMNAARWRAAGLGFGGVLALVFLVLFFWRGGEWLLNQAVYDNPAFAIQRVEVSTDGVIAPQIIRKWSMVKLGQNLLSLDLLRVKRDLEAQPPIESVAVERVLPNTLRLFITERQPVAQTLAQQARRDGGVATVVYDFDENGYVMQPLDPAWRQTPAPTNAALPVLLGVPLVELQTINVGAPEILEATTSQGAQIDFSLNQFELQLQRWREIYDQYQQWGKAIVSLDLSVSNNLPVRWIAANGMPPLLHKSVKAIKPKRKNV